MRAVWRVIVDAWTGADRGMKSGAVVEKPSSVASPAAAAPNAATLRTLPVTGSRRKSDGSGSWPEPVSTSARGAPDGWIVNVWSAAASLGGNACATTSNAEGAAAEGTGSQHGTA